MSPPEPAPGQRWGRYLGVTAVLLFAVVAIHTVLNKGTLVRGIEPGHRLPPFAVPLALGGVNGDANVATHSDDGSAGRVPACSVRGPQLLNLCQLYERGPVVLALFVDASSCDGILDDMQALAPSFPGVQFAAVAIKGNRARLRRADSGAAPDPAGWHRQRRRGRDHLPGGELSAGELRLPGRGGAERRAAHAPNACDAARARVRARGGGAGARMEGHGRVSPLEAFEPAFGWCAREVEQELPELRVLLDEVQVGGRSAVTGDSPRAVREHLRELSNKFRGARAVAVRREPVPAAYRAFFPQIGLDPDVMRTPIEAAVLDRMLRGGFPSRGLLADVLLIALLDRGVPVWALDSECVDGPARHPPEPRGGAAGALAGRAAAPGRPARDRGRLLGACDPVRPACSRARARALDAPADAVRDPGGGRAGAVRGGGAVALPCGARAVLRGVRRARFGGCRAACRAGRLGSSGARRRWWA